MTIASYTGLQASVADWLHRSDLAARVPDFISLGEADLRRKLAAMSPRPRQMSGRAISTINAEYEAQPADFNGLQALKIAGGDVSMVEPETLAQRARTPRTGMPEVVAVVGSEFRFFPAPDTSYSVEMLYWRVLPSLSAATPTNWLLTLYPDAYLYAALAHSAPFIRDDARLTVWVGAYSTILASIEATAAAERDSASRAPLRTDVPRHRRHWSRHWSGGLC